MTNWRYNPFRNIVGEVDREEFHEIKDLPEVPQEGTGLFYGIRVNEGILRENPSSVIIEDATDVPDRSNPPNNLTRFRENLRDNPPEEGFFRVDYDDYAIDGTTERETPIAFRNLNTGLIEFNEEDNGKLARVRYKGTGTILKEGLALEPPGSFRWHFPNYTGAWSVNEMRAVGWVVMDGTTPESQDPNAIIRGFNLPDMMPSADSTTADDDGYFIKAAKKPANGMYDSTWESAVNNLGHPQDDAQFDLSSMRGAHNHGVTFSGQIGSATNSIYINGITDYRDGGEGLAGVNTELGGHDIFTWPAGIRWATRTRPRNISAVPFLKVR